MMQHGLVSTIGSSAGNHSVSTDPVFCKGLLLESQTARTMLEGLRRCCPFKFDDPESCARRDEYCDAFILSFCCDRAATNGAVLKPIWSLLQQPGMPRNIFPFVEFCAAHGVALIRGRPQCSKTLVAVSHTLSSCFRQWSFAAAFRDELL